MPDRVPVSWKQDPAFRAWFTDSFATLAIALGAIQADVASWQTSLTIAGIAIGKGLLNTVPHLLWWGPDLYQDAPPPAPPDLAATVAALQKQLADIQAAKTPPPP